jgi:hypothetical protein
VKESASVASQNSVPNAAFEVVFTGSLPMNCSGKMGQVLVGSPPIAAHTGAGSPAAT